MIRAPRLASTLLAGLGLVAALGPPAVGAPGDLDNSFDGDGKVVTDFGVSGDSGQGVVVQPDGKIIVAGYASMPVFDFAVVRYKRGGAPDATFGGDGKVTTDFGSGSDSGYAVALQEDGKIVVVGSASGGAGKDFGVVRYKPGGGLDLSFSGDGKVRTDFGSSEEAYAVAIQRNGKIVVVGWADRATADFGVARYRPDGRLDRTFSGDGRLWTHFGSGDDQAKSVAILDGRIVVAGYAFNGSDYDFAVARYGSRGRLDATFGGGGRVTTGFGSGDDLGDALAIQPDGRILVAGYASNGADYDFALVRYEPRGARDTAFSGDGRRVTPFFSGDDLGYGVALQPDGRIVVVGTARVAATYDFAAARYKPRGGLDGSFVGAGTETTSIGAADDMAFGVVIQPDGGIVVAGQAWWGTGTDFAAVRYLG